MKNRSPYRKPLLFITTIAIAVIATIVLWKMGSGREEARSPAATAPLAQEKHDAAPPAPPTPPAPNNPPQSPAAMEVAGRTFDTFQLRPFPVAQETGAHAWTKEDGRSPDAILEIAHNQAEVERLLEENTRIERRQLVYRKEPAYQVVQQARAAGEPVQKLTVPGLDGRELEMEVVNADLDPSGLRGTFSGRLRGSGQSMVTLSFKEGREAFSVVSPQDGIFLQGHPREPGEIIVTSYDPDKYQPLPGGEPIRPPQTPTPSR